MLTSFFRQLGFLSFARQETGSSLAGSKTCTKQKKVIQEPGTEEEKNFSLQQIIGLIIGPALFAVIMFIPETAKFTYAMKAAAATTLWIAAWWITEAVPLAAASLLPLILFPLTGVLSFDNTALGYANNIVFLFMGGFMIAVAMERWSLHRRVALSIVKFIGTNPKMLLLGFMVSTGFLSMWISNTATAMMMMPVGLAVIKQLSDLASAQGLDIGSTRGKFSFGTALMLCIAYGASIGGLGTLIGSPPNAIFAVMAGKMFKVNITFTQWFLYGVPIAIIFTLLAWLYLIKATALTNLSKLKGGNDVIEKELKSLGPITKGEKLTGLVFIIVALSWICSSLFLKSLIPSLSDSLIAVIGILLLFLLPVDFKNKVFVLDWKTAAKIPWDILILFGGGIAIASGFTETGLASWFGVVLGGIHGAPLIAVMLLVVTVIILLTNVTSNTGCTSMMLPVMASMSMALSVHPFTLMIAATTAASFAFLLPAGTPPNAVVFGSGQVSIPQMVKAGMLLTIATIILVPIFIYFFVPNIWGIDINVFPKGW